jgi:hypothetical protein
VPAVCANPNEPWTQVVVVKASAPVSAVLGSTVSPQLHSGAFAPARQPRSGTSNANPIAERVVQLGGTAEGTIQVGTTRTALEAYPLVPMEKRDHVEALSPALVACGTGVRRAINQADALGDRDTADIFTEMWRGVDKYLWFVEAHLGQAGAATRGNQCS